MISEYKLSKYLKKCAVKAGLCDLWTQSWSDKETYDSLIAMFKKGIDFTIDKGLWFDVDFVKNAFPSGMLEDNGIYIYNGKFSMNDLKDPVVLCSASVNMAYNMYSVSDVYVIDGSANIIVNDMAIVNISVYGTSSVVVSGKSAAKTRIYLRSKQARAVTTGNCVIKPYVETKDFLD